MKKHLLILVLMFVTASSLWAQRDTEHWFAPMRDRASSTTSVQTLFLSTDSVTPFPVNIYNNNAVIGTVTISKGNPGTFIVPRTAIIATSDGECMTTSTKGLYLQGTSPFYASLRMYISSHGEFIASKGKAGIGTQFRAVVTPNNYVTSITNFVTSVLATVDNTTITINGYQPAVQFAGGATGATLPSINITLNKGQSYIVEGPGTVAGNANAFSGALISSDKPISVMNGNMNGNYALGSFGGSDIIMDQSVPIERLGKTFVIIKGNANIGTNMEGALITATEDQTDIFLNGSPTAAATINAGQTFRVMDTNYIDQGSGHYNLYISTTKNVYVYQLIGGRPTDNATEGWNYIPPLSCYLPRKIDEIGMVNSITPTNNSTNLSNWLLKLNILTEAGATVTINGTPPPAGSGPFTVTGTTNWVTYSVPNPTGNITINSNKAVTAGVTGGYSSAGFGGYFAGFSSVPAIVKETGDCIPGIILAVDDIYTTYQWFLNGNPIAGANTFQYTPTMPGVYTCTVSIPGCAPVTTPPYEVFPCPTNTTQTVNVCGGRQFTVAFSNSTQPLDLSSITITTQPAHGTVTVNNLTGTINYVPAVGYLGPDTFTYEFQSTVPTFFDSEIVTVNINVVLLETDDDTLTACPYNGVATYDLTTADVSDYPLATFNYYPTLTDAQNGTNEILTPAAYVSAAGSVFVKVTTPEGCVDYSKITLLFYAQPQVNDAVMQSCFIPLAPTTAIFDLTTANVGGGPGAVKNYFTSLADAENNTNEIQNPFVYNSTNNVVYVRVYNNNGCYSIAKITLNVIPPTYSTVLEDKIICIEDRTTLDAGPGFDAYEWSTGATTQSISNVTVGEYWVILTKNGCETTQTVKVTKVPEVVITNIDITNNTVTLAVKGGEQPYQYSADGINWQDSNVFTEVPRGQNIFFVKDSYNCEPVTVEITVPNLINVITPNEDGVNDYIDYSALRYKQNLTFSVYDRYGNRVHLADKNNFYRWDGRFASKKVITGTYWYHITWNEPDGTQAPVMYKGWILVKNRE
ncbi:gliding motility-associated C-terminal domain-containing protein [Marnyiella aurantia]|uniref:Gliding motility-associated C-terminal domain-containing protein n=1 Tax=Marnyiella aurantia TaxID=2758037 RepID=A0A7D7R405_9FLAO|nr:T9SS type B sorting domain-containing protein [Marnyiella aurantia]MBA5247767.1 gliding motility-associated C-terminal domain-containing protein [Marnyiella aurantia]QMS97349.1 gliding motility-associated C-terminal domain-containing protein [Marnyiella aurantia]